MPEPRPQAGHVLTLFADLLDCDPATVDHRLAQVPVAVAAEVRALLEDDASSAELHPDDFTHAVAALVGPDRTRMPPSPVGFEVLSLIGRGAMGEVYHAIQQSPRRSVALKFVDGDGVAEAQALVDARHPSIPEVYLVESTPHGAFVAMELVEGVPLKTWAATADLDACLVLFEQLCQGVEQIHRRGLLHRDLKPAHVLVDDRGPRLVDFGLAIDREQAANVTVGTAAYLADEVLDGGPATVASEVFSLTCILVEMVTGSRAMPRARTAQAQRTARRTHELPALPPGVDPIVRRGLGPAADRHPSAAALAEAIRELLRARNPLVPAPNHRRRRQALVALGLVGTLALIGLIVVQWRMLQHEHDAEAALQRLEATLAGTPAEQAESLVRFANLEQAEGTVAADRARLLAADRLASVGDRRGSQDLLAEVFEQSAPFRNQAAEGLAAGFLEDRNWGSVAAVATLLPKPLRGSLQTRAAVGLRDWYRDDIELPKLVQALRDATPTHVKARTIWTGGGRYLAFDGGQVVEGPLSPTLSPATPVGGREAWGRRIPFVVGEEPLVVYDRPENDQVVLRHPTAAQWDDFAEVELAGQVWSAALGDPNGDGTPTLFLGTAPAPRHLSALEPPDWTPKIVDAGLDRTDSDYEQLEIADLDGDGVDELIMALGPWQAHDVRVYRQLADGSLTLLGRARLGGAAHIAVVPLQDGTSRLACLKVDTYPNPRIFGAETPLGKPAGLHVFAFDGKRLAQTESYPIQGLSLPWAGVQVGDFDGDGDADIVGGGSQDSVILELDAQGAVVDEHRVDGMRALGTADVDQDGVDELLVNLDDDARVWVLGAGKLRVPTRSTAVDPQSGDLERLALYGSAARMTRIRAEVEDDPQRAAQLFLDSARLFRLDEQPTPALEMLDRSLELQPTPAAWEAKAALLAYLVRYPQMATLPPQYRRGPAQLDVFRPDLVHSLPAAVWRRPLALSHPPGSGLVIEGSPGDDVVLSIPVTRTGDVVGIEVDLEVASAEMGVQLDIGLVGADGPLVGTRLLAWGGAGQVRRWTQCTVGENSRDLALDPDRPYAVDGLTRHQTRVALEGGELACALRIAFEDQVSKAGFFRRSEALQPLPQDLRVDVRITGPEPAARIQAVLRSLVVTGVVPAPVEESLERRQVVLGGLEGVALGPLEQLEFDARLGRTEQAVRRLASTPIDDRSALIAAIRRQPEFWMELLRTEAPEQLTTLVPEVWSIVLASGPSQATTQHLSQLWVDALPATTPATARYLFERASRLATISPSRASRLLRRLTTEAPVAERAPSWVALAAILADAGDAAGAADACRQARASETVPLLVDDLLAAEPLLNEHCGR